MKKIFFLCLIILLFVFCPVQAVIPWVSSNGCWTYSISGESLVMWNDTIDQTFTIPPGVISLQYEVVGSGGSGAGYYYGGGGSPGVVRNGTINVTPGDTVTVKIGAPGAAQTNQANGNNGGNSTFGPITSNGGLGGYTGLGTGVNGDFQGGVKQSGTSSATPGHGAADSSHGAGGAGGNSTDGTAGTATPSGGNGGDCFKSYITGELEERAAGGGGGAFGGLGGLGGCSNRLGGKGAGSDGVAVAGTNGSGGGGGAHTSGGISVGAAGGKGKIIIRFTAKPIASFTATPSSGIEPLFVQINDTSTENPTSWDYTIKGYGFNTSTYANASTIQNPTFTFSKGNYTVVLIASNLGGSDTSLPVWINVSSPSLPVDFIGFPRTDCHPLNVSFTDQSNILNPTAYLWSFGDGNISTLKNPFNIYYSSGLFDVTFTVTNASSSGTTTKTGYVDTTNCPVPTPQSIGQRWCGIQRVYFQNDNSTAPLGYENLLNYPWGNPEDDDNVTLQSSFGYVPIDFYITPEGFPRNTFMEKSAWEFNSYRWVSITAGNTTLNYSVFKRNDSTSTETYLFSAESSDINDISPAYALTGYSMLTNLSFDVTDRLVVKVYGKTTHSSPVQLHFLYQGYTHNSNFDSGYFVCPDTSSVVVTTMTTIPASLQQVYIPNIPVAQTTGFDTADIPWWGWLLVLAVIIILIVGMGRRR